MPKVTTHKRLLAILTISSALGLGIACAEGGPTAPEPVLTTVSVQLSAASVIVGQTTTATVSGRDQNNAAIPVTGVAWSSALSSIATVSPSGVVTGVSAGTTSISATSSGRVGTAIITVLPVPVASVTISPASATITAGQTQQLSATPRDAANAPLADRSVSWSTANAGIAQVSTSGLVTAVSAGTTTITALSEGRSASVTVTVLPAPVASVTVSPTTATFATGQSQQLTATPSDAAGNVLTGRSISWSTSNAAVANVSTNGLVTGIATGTAIITASVEGRTATSSITVTPVPVASVSVAPSTATLAVGQTQQLTATPRSADGTALSGRSLSWTSSNSAVAQVSTSGLVSALATGSATITVTVEGRTATSAITVTAPAVSTVTVDPPTFALVAGQTRQMTATARDAAGNVIEGRPVTWRSSDTLAATVSATGLVTARMAGTPSISATVEGRTGFASMTAQNSTLPCQLTGAAPLAIDQAVSGVVTGTDCVYQSYSSDLYRLTITGTQSVTVALSGEAAPPYTWVGLRDGTGQYLSASDSAFNYYLSAGTYYVVVNSYFVSSLIAPSAYTLTVRSRTTCALGTGGTIPIPTVVDGALTTSDCLLYTGTGGFIYEADIFRFSLPVNTPLQMTVTPNAFPMRLYTYGPSGGATASSAEGALEYDFPAGTYTLATTGSPRNYRLTVDSIPRCRLQDAVLITLPAAVLSTLNGTECWRIGRTDLYRFVLDSARTVDFTVTRQGIDIFLETILNTNGTDALRPQGLADLNAGTNYVAIRGDDSDYGDYLLSGRVVPRCALADAEVITVPTTLSRVLTTESCVFTGGYSWAGYTRFFKMTVPTTRSVTATVTTGANLYPDVVILNSTGTVIDGSSERLATSATFTRTYAPGTYYFAVRLFIGNGTGGFTLTIQ